LKSYATIARQYAKDVVVGKIMTCKWGQRACERQLVDLNRFKGKDSRNRFNPKLTKKNGWAFQPADNLYAFIERLHLVKGPLACETIKFEPSKVFILTTVFGWVKPDGNRRFRRSPSLPSRLPTLAGSRSQRSAH
jgi:phage terminase large subunit-like protein